jgi:hypothetical protein
MASNLLSSSGSNERGQNRLSDASCLHGAVHPFRSLDLEWPVPVAGKNAGRSDLVSLVLIRLRRTIKDCVQQQPDTRGPDHSKPGLGIKKDDASFVDRFIDERRCPAQQIFRITFPEKAAYLKFGSLEGENVRPCVSSSYPMLKKSS